MGVVASVSSVCTAKRRSQRLVTAIEVRLIQRAPVPDRDRVPFQGRLLLAFLRGKAGRSAGTCYASRITPGASAFVCPGWHDAADPERSFDGIARILERAERRKPITEALGTVPMRSRPWQTFRIASDAGLFAFNLWLLS